MKLSSVAPRIAGRISGSVTYQMVLIRPAPHARAASSRPVLIRFITGIIRMVMIGTVEALMWARMMPQNE